MSMKTTLRSLIIAMVTIMAGMAIFVGLFLLYGGNYIIGYSSSCLPILPCSFSSGTLAQGLMLEVTGASLMVVGFAALIYSIRRMGLGFSTAIGYVFLTIGILSTVFISAMMLFARFMGHIGDGLYAYYPLAILGITFGIVVMHSGSKKGKPRNSTHNISRINEA